MKLIPPTGEPKGLVELRNVANPERALAHVTRNDGLRNVSIQHTQRPSHAYVISSRCRPVEEPATRSCRRCARHRQRLTLPPSHWWKPSRVVLARPSCPRFVDSAVERNGTELGVLLIYIPLNNKLINLEMLGKSGRFLRPSCRHNLEVSSGSGFCCRCCCYCARLQRSAGMMVAYKIAHHARNISKLAPASGTVIVRG